MIEMCHRFALLSALQRPDSRLAPHLRRPCPRKAHLSLECVRILRNMPTVMRNHFIFHATVRLVPRFGRR